MRLLVEGKNHFPKGVENVEFSVKSEEFRGSFSSSFLFIFETGYHCASEDAFKLVLLCTCSLSERRVTGLHHHAQTFLSPRPPPSFFTQSLTEWPYVSLKFTM